MTASLPPSRGMANPDAPSCTEVGDSSEQGGPRAKGMGLFSPKYRGAIKKNLVLQVLLLGLTLLMLDFGQSFRVCSITAAAYWTAVAMIMLRRPESRTQSDLIVVRYGFWLFLIVNKVVTPIVWKVTGQV